MILKIGSSHGTIQQIDHPPTSQAHIDALGSAHRFSWPAPPPVSVQEEDFEADYIVQPIGQAKDNAGAAMWSRATKRKLKIQRTHVLSSCSHLLFIPRERDMTRALRTLGPLSTADVDLLVSWTSSAEGAV